MTRLRLNTAAFIQGPRSLGQVILTFAKFFSKIYGNFKVFGKRVSFRENVSHKFHIHAFGLKYGTAVKKMIE